MPDGVESTVLEMYLNGCSQQEVRRNLNIPIVQVYSILRKAGIDTAAYRRLDPAICRVIDALLEHNVFYRDIETYCDVSYDAVRERVKRTGRYQRGHDRSYYQMNYSDAAFPGFAPILCRYNSGESFASIVNDLGLTDEQIYAAFYHLWNACDTLAHIEHLQARIQAQLDLGYSLSAVAKRERISRSIVNAYVRSTQCRNT